MSNNAEKYIDVLLSKIDSVKNALSTIKNTINAVINFAVKCFQKLTQAVKLCISIIVTFKNAISKVLSILGGFGNRVREIISLKGAMQGLAHVTDLVCNSFNKFLNNGFVSNGLALEQSLQSMKIILGEDLTNATVEWANALERGFGLSANGIITDLKELTGVMYGLGMSAENTSIASKNLLMVGNTLSNIIGYDTETVIRKIESGMKGMTQSVDDLGLSVRESEMNAFLKELKKQGGEYESIATNFASLTEEQRVYVRYASLMQQYLNNYDIDKYIKSLEELPGRINLLKNQLRTLVSTIGQYMLNMFDAIIKPIIVFVADLTAAVNFVANILGKQENKKKEDSGVNDIKEDADEAAKSVDNVTNSVEDLKSSLDGLDHISNLSSSNSSSSGLDGSAFDYSSLMNNYDENLFEKMEKEALEKTKGYIEETRQELENNFNTWFKKVTGREVKLKFDADDLKTKISKALTTSQSIFEKVGNTIGATFIKCLEDLQVDKLSSTLFGTVVDVLEMISAALDRIEPYFNTFYENAIAPLLNTLGTNLNDWLTGLSEKSQELKTGFENGDYDEQIQNIFDTITEYIKKIAIVLKSLFTGEVLSLDEIVDLGGTESTFGKINDIALSINSIFKNICDILGNLSEDFVNWLKDEGLSQIRDFIDRFDKFIKDNKDTIIRILEKLGETIWTAILSFAEAMLNLLQFICDNETLVISVLDTIIKALDFVGKHASDCAKVFLALTGFKLVLDVLGSISSAVGTISGIALAGKLNNLCKIIGSGSTGTVGAVNTLSGTLTNKLGNALKGAVTGIKNFASSITGTLANAIANVTGGASVGAAGIGVGAVAGAAVVTVEGTRQIVDMVSDTVAGYQAADDYVKQIIEKWADKDENGAYYMEQAVYDRIIEILQSDKYDAEYKKAKETYGVFAGLADTDVYQRGFKVTARDFANAMGDEIKKACIIVEDTSINEQTEATNSNTKSLDDVISMGYELKDVGTDLVATYTKTDAEIKNAKSLDDLISGRGIKSTRSISGYANGGIPKSGSLFFANENGNSELIGNFGGYSGVANNQMIMSSIQNGVYQAVKKALAESSGSSQTNNITVAPDGLFIGDEASIRKLATLINNANRKSNQNIANTGYVM